jgi:hypothetical protein
MKYRVTYWVVNEGASKMTWSFPTIKEARQHVKDLKAKGGHHTFKVWKLVEES